MTRYPSDKNRANVPTYGTNRPPACVHCAALESPRRSRIGRACAFLLCFALGIGAILLAGALIGGAP